MNDQSKRVPTPHCTLCHQQFDLYYRTPRVVPRCGHTFCEKCMTLRMTVKVNRRVFICPDCGAEVVIRKNVGEDVPKNMGIIDVVKSLRKYSFNEWQQQKSSIGQTCSEHSRPLELICQTCNYKKICSHCALFGQHRNHSFVKEMPATKTDLTELKNSFDVIRDSIQKFLLPEGAENIKKSMKNALTLGLKGQVSATFKQYHAMIQRKQLQLMQECENLIINEGGIDNNIDSLVKEYDRLKNKYENQFGFYNSVGLSKDVSVDSIELFMSKCDELHGNLEKLMTHSSEHIEKIIKDIGVHIMQATIFKIQEMPFSIKKVVEIVNTPPELSSPNKRARVKSNASESKTKSVVFAQQEEKTNFHSFDRANRSHNKAATTAVTGRKPRETYSHIDKGEKNSEDFSTLEKGGQSDLGFYKEQPQKELKELISNKMKTFDRSNLPPKAQKSKLTSGSQTMAIRNTLKDGPNAPKSKERKSFGKELSPARSVNGHKSNASEILITEDLKFVQPTKEISFHFLSKFQEIITEIDRQSGLNTLQLNSMDINDVLLVYLLDYMRTKKYNFQVIKLVKNSITDEGMRALMSYLINDNTTQVLNLTSNQLTARSLQLILLFAAKNNMLRTMYLSNNKISAFQVKGKKSQLQKYELQINI